MIKGLHIVRASPARGPTKWYVYAWRGGPKIMVATGAKPTRLTPEAVEAYRNSIDAHKRATGHTIGGLIADYRSPNSLEWSRLEASTKYEWGRTLDAINTKWGEVPLSVFEDFRIKAKVKAWRNSMKETPRKADYHIQVLVALLQWGVSEGRITANHALETERLYGGGARSHIIWTADDLAKFYEHAPQHIGDAVKLAELTGLRRSDLVAIPWSADKGDILDWVTLKSRRGGRKGNRRVVMPIIAEARAFLDALKARPRKKGVDTILVNSKGRAWSEDGLTSRFIPIRDKAAVVDDDGDGKHFHDLRGAFATRLMLNGLQDDEIAELMGWSTKKTEAIRRTYVDQAARVMAIRNRLSAASVKPGVKTES